MSAHQKTFIYIILSQDQRTLQKGGGTKQLEPEDEEKG